MNLMNNKNNVISSNNDNEYSYWKIPGEKNKFYTDDDVFKQINNIIYNKKCNCEIAIGTDSQVNDRYLKFITVISVWFKGKGGIYYYRTEYIQKSNLNALHDKNVHHNRTHYNQKLRIYEEVSKAIELASKIEKQIGIRPIIHIDASNSNENNYTSTFSEQLKGYVLCSGFECVLKPYSYAANCIADRHTKQNFKKGKNEE